MTRRGPLTRLAGIAHELSVVRLFRLRDWPRLCCDVLLFRALRFARLPREGALRSVRMRDGTLLTYRLNRGDIQAIREIWLDQVYMPRPEEAAGLRQVVDVGANIGFTSLYLHGRLAAQHVVAVEPDPENVMILCRNLEQNGVPATVIDAAVGPSDGHTSFRRDRASNLGYVDAEGDITVRVVSMATVLDRLPSESHRTLLKVDIEGGEEALFTGDLSWLQRFDYLMAEFHPLRANMERILALIEASGLHHHPGGGRTQPTPCWIRTERATPASG